MRKPFFLLVIFLVFIGCNETKEPKIESNYKSINEKSISNKYKDEDFGEFFKKFSKDSIFQKGRVNFPIKVVILDSEKLIEDTIILTNKNYHFQNIESDSKDYDIIKKINDNKATVTLRGIENGIFMELFFIKRNGKWILITWNNFST